MNQEDFIATKWFNSIFSELRNFELVQNPTEDGFMSDTATLKKREWLYTEQWVGWVYNRQTDDVIRWKIVVWGVAFVWDDSCNVYRFEKDNNSYVLSKVYDNPGNESTIKEIRQKAIKIPYLSKYVSSWTADKVLSTNDDWNWDTKLVVNEDGTFTADSVGQYIYFTNSASAQARGQIRQIMEYIDWKTVLLSTMFYWDPIDWEVDEAWETYETIDEVIVFNNIRNSNWLVLCVWVHDNEAHFRNLGGLDIEIFEWRYRYINSYWTSLGWSVASWEFEILDPDTIRGASLDARWQKMESLVLTKNYLLVNQENSMSVVWQIAATEDESPVFNLNTILTGDSAWGVDSLYYEWWLYYLWKNGVFKWWDIVAVSSNIIYWETKNQWFVISRFLKEINDKTFVRLYDYGDGSIIQYINGWKTTMLVYNSLYEWRIPATYNMEIYDKFEQFFWDLLICVGDKVCIRWWNNDLWEDIKVRVVVSWSDGYINSLFSLKKIKLSLGYYDNVVKFKMRLDLWGSVFESKVEKDANGVEYLVRHNVVGSNQGLWYIPFGFWAFGGQWTLGQPNIARVGLVWIPIWRKCSYYTLALENIDNYDLNIVWISVLTEGWAPYITPSNNVF